MHTIQVVGLDNSSQPPCPPPRYIAVNNVQLSWGQKYAE